MMLSRSTASALGASLLASGCVIVPVTTESYDPDCRFVTRHMELQPVQIARLQLCSDRGCEVMVLVGLGVTAASAIVSGSIVVVGNVVYWADHRANCQAPVAAPAAPASA
jgi:hypothetical protein